LQRHDFLAVVGHRVDARHADVLQHFQVLEVVVGKGHPEACGLDLRQVPDQGFELLVIHQVDLAGSDARGEVEFLADAERIGFAPLAVLPVAALGGHFADVDLRVEIGGEGLAVVAGVAIDDVQLADAVELVLAQPGGEDIGDARIEAAAEQRHQPPFAKPLLVRPLPGVFEGGLVAGFVVGGVQVVDTGRQAGIHDGQVLIGQGDVDHQFGPHSFDQRAELGRVVGIHSGGLDGAGDLRGDGVALGFGAARQHDIREDFRHLGALVGDHLADAARSDDQYLGHAVPSFNARSRCSHAIRWRRVPPAAGVPLD